MTETQLSILAHGENTVTAIRSEPEGRPADWTFLYAPGAGSNVHDPFGTFACRELATRGITSIRFQFPYMEEGKRRPDRPAVVEATWRAVIEELREGAPRLCVGGRSFGGRIASQVVADGTVVEALALFAYPLHPPGNPAKSRDQHLPAIPVPTLFCSGTRDSFAAPEELRAAAKKVGKSKVHLLEAADHGFAAPKASGRKREDVWQEAVTVLLEWLDVAVP